MYSEKLKILCLSAILLVCLNMLTAQNYPTPDELKTSFENLAKSNQGKVKIHPLAVSPGGNQLIVAELGNEKTGLKNPAIFVLADPEGTNPMAAYASTILARMILKDEKNLNFTWYILPTLNPDALKNYFSKVLWKNPRNATVFNDDQDEVADEDGPDDLNHDGFITQMRVKDPLGTMMIDETDKRLLRRADPAKGEKGIYTVYTEGIDNDNDGTYNEDPPGGVNTGVNFPHLFKPFTTTAGLWPGSTPEVYALMKFIFQRPEIAASFVMGNTNFCLVPPEGGRKSTVDYNKIVIPDNMLESFNAEKGKTYTITELIELLQPYIEDDFEITPAMIINVLGLGEIINPLSEDVTWYKELSDQYKVYLKKSGFDLERLGPEKAKDGSFELWSYYHLGVPAFSFNFFTLPAYKAEKKDSSGISTAKLEAMKGEDFTALGEDVILKILKENNAAEKYKPLEVIEMVKSGKTTPKQLSAMLKAMPKPKSDSTLKALISFSDKNLKGKGYIDWQPYKHPVLGDVEIGGAVPFTLNVPPFAWADSLINLQLPWIFTLVDKLPQVKFAKYEVKDLGKDVWQIEIWVENTKYLPFPTAMGQQNRNAAPCILTLEADSLEFLSGYKRTPVRALGGLKATKLTFIVRLTRGKAIKASLESKSMGNDSLEIKLQPSK